MKKPVVKKAAVKKAPVKKAALKKTPPKKAAVKKTAVVKAPSKKIAVKTAVAKKPVAKKATLAKTKSVATKKQAAPAKKKVIVKETTTRSVIEKSAATKAEEPAVKKPKSAPHRQRRARSDKNASGAPIDIAKRQAELDANQKVDENSSAGIASQIEAFLSKGKEINEIPVGVSGITHTGGTKHITISRNKPQNQATS